MASGSLIRPVSAGDRIAIISPHLDDAVLSCGNLLGAHRDSVVVTLFSGMPPPDTPLTEWDRLCGFADCEEAMQARHHENEAALALLGARSLNLGLLDGQYAVAEDAAQLAGALARALAGLDVASVFMPLGLFHPDHVRASEACLAAWPLFDQYGWFAYSDALYRRRPGVLQQRLADLRARRIYATPIFLPQGCPVQKTRAVAAYASQLAALDLAPGQGDDAAAEGYWHFETK
jgi:LmbE family N-acetylglucosaminyl deacetylase